MFALCFYSFGFAIFSSYCFALLASCFSLHIRLTQFYQTVCIMLYNSRIMPPLSRRYASAQFISTQFSSARLLASTWMRMFIFSHFVSIIMFNFSSLRLLSHCFSASTNTLVCSILFVQQLQEKSSERLPRELNRTEIKVK